MSERPTPETDSAWEELYSNFSRYRIAEKMKTYCQEKERERDEAREKNAKIRDIAEWFANQFFENDGDERWPSCPVTKNAQKLRAELDQLKEGAK